MRVTIIGASGFIGKSLSAFLRARSVEVIEVDKGYVIKKNFDYGVIVYSVGGVFDYQNRTSVEAHVFVLDQWLTTACFSRIVYLSSTRLYRNLDLGQETCERFIIDGFDLHNQTKLVGESLLMVSGREYLIVRLSNVLGYQPNAMLFLWNMFREAKFNRRIFCKESEKCVRDYVLIEDVLNTLLVLVKQGATGIFNVCSGQNISNLEVVEIISAYQPLDEINFGLLAFSSPVLMNEKIKKFYGIEFSNVKQQLNKICKVFFVDSCLEANSMIMSYESKSVEC